MNYWQEIIKLVRFKIWLSKIKNLSLKEYFGYIDYANEKIEQYKKKMYELHIATR